MAAALSPDARPLLDVWEDDDRPLADRPEALLEAARDRGVDDDTLAVVLDLVHEALADNETRTFGDPLTTDAEWRLLESNASRARLLGQRCRRWYAGVQANARRDGGHA